jgi:hypothetical protein
MKKLLATMAACIALTGCVVPTKQEVSKMSTLSICYNITTASSKEAVLMYMDEIKYRNADCNQYATEVHAMRAAEANKERQVNEFMNGLAAGFNAGRAASQPALRCRSSTFGGVTTTNCN